MLDGVLPLRTARLDLRPFTDDDLPAVLAIYGPPETSRYLYSEPLDQAGARRWLAERAAVPAMDGDGQWLALAIEERGTGAVLGSTAFQLASRTHRQGEVGFVLHPGARGRGVATEAAAALLHLGFEVLGLHRLVGRCDARNEASAAVLQRLGMRQEAHLVENEWVKGEWTDERIFALLAREWRQGPFRPAPPGGGR